MISLSATSVLCATQASESSPSLQSDTTLSAEGYFVLSWSLPVLSNNQAAATGILQQALNPDFANAEDIIVNHAGSMTLTGLPDGLYFYRAGTPEAWTEVVQVTVQHHSLQRAFMYFFMGLLLFVALVAVIFVGQRNAGGEHG